MDGLPELMGAMAARRPVGRDPVPSRRPLDPLMLLTESERRDPPEFTSRRRPGLFRIRDGGVTKPLGNGSSSRRASRTDSQIRKASRGRTPEIMAQRLREAGAVAERP